MKNYNLDAFLALVRAGLWEQDVQLLQYGNIDYNVIYKLAQEQSVVGLVAAGLEHVIDVKVPQHVALVFVRDALQLEQRNRAMNDFIGKIVGEMQAVGIDTVLVKGQGVAQCYERPLWRASGDVDFLFDKKNYYNALNYFLSLAPMIGTEDPFRMQTAFNIKSWIVELHGSLHTELWGSLDTVLDKIQEDTFFNHHIRIWHNNETNVNLPVAENDSFFVFSHILQHFFKEGVGLRQVCDWNRLLWKYKDQINSNNLEAILRNAGTLSEWRLFSYFSVKYLGMPINAIPVYKPLCFVDKRAKMILNTMLITGNMGHNKDYSYRSKYPFFLQKIISVKRYFSDFWNHSVIFPVDSFKALCSILYSGFRVTMNNFKKK